jgi:chromosomal replication initiator protein
MQIWFDFLQTQEKRFGKETVERWLRSLKIVKFDACNLYLNADNSFQQLWFEEHIRPQLKSFVNNNKTPIQVHLKLSKESAQKSPKASKKKIEAPTFTIQFEEIDPSATFEQYITSNANLIISKLLDELFQPQASPLPNPIYLFGPEGSGKTHLLMALANRYRKAGLQVIFARTELFTDHVVRAIRTAEMPRFREIYRKADVFIVDDVHELQKKAATQEEFFHTFNTLHTAGKQIILSSNVSPQGLQAIEPRLVSRFEWGISLPLQPLEKKEVMQLLEKRALFMDTILHPRTIEFMAENFASSPKAAIHALQALLLRTQLPGKLDRSPIQVAQAKTHLADLLEQEKQEKLTPEKILQAVAEFYGIRVDDITCKSQSRDSSLPRQLSMYLCREQLRLPYMKIGDLFERDHSTVMSAIRQIEKQINGENMELRAHHLAISQKLSR